MNKNPEFRIQNSEAGTYGADEAIIERLKSLPTLRVSHDLAPEILAKVRAEVGQSALTHCSSRRLGGIFSETLPARRRLLQWRRVYSLAAAAALVLLLGGLWLAGTKPLDPAVRAAAWLCQTQEPDGSWSAAKWGGDSHFEVALTGLSLMTLLEDSGPSRDCDLSIDKAVAYLIRSQQENGQFGELFASAPYNQGIATLALGKAFRGMGAPPMSHGQDARATKHEALRLALDRAIAAICARQYRDGGWGYSNEARPASNLSITLWQIEALRLAAAQGWPQARPVVERGLRWMAGVAADDGSFGYRTSGDTPGGASQTLTAMGAMSLLDPAHIGLVSPDRRVAIKSQMQRLASTPGPDLDYYRRYFLAAALKKMDEEPAHRGLAAIRQELVTRQVRRGGEAGSWKADDRWGSSGGRIYATALASLSLR